MNTYKSVGVDTIRLVRFDSTSDVDTSDALIRYLLKIIRYKDVVK